MMLRPFGAQELDEDDASALSYFHHPRISQEGCYKNGKGFILKAKVGHESGRTHLRDAPIFEAV